MGWLFCQRIRFSYLNACHKYLQKDMMVSEFEKDPERVDGLETLTGHLLIFDSIVPFHRRYAVSVCIWDLFPLAMDTISFWIHIAHVPIKIHSIVWMWEVSKESTMMNCRWSNLTILACENMRIELHFLSIISLSFEQMRQCSDYASCIIAGRTYCMAWDLHAR
jgi:hypothetical protein